MTVNEHLTPEGEAEWLRLKTHIEWCDYFALGFVFSAHPGVIRVFRERLADIYRARVTRLQISIPEHPAALFQELLPRLLRPSVHQQSLRAPIWIDLTGKSGDGWEKARLEFLMRLNEQREVLRKALSQPLILVLPLEAFSHIKELVPDLWSIRDFTLKTASWIVPVPGKKDIASQDSLPSTLKKKSEYELSLIEEWQRLSKKKKKDRGFLLAAERAYQVCMANRDYSLAGQIAETQKNFSENQIRQTGETPESLRDLSVSLNKVGDTARALGEWETAQGCYEESLGIRRKIIDRVGETPESLRDLSVSLNKVGDTARALGEWETAQGYYEEALAVSIPLSEKHPNHDDYKDLADHFRTRLADLKSDKKAGNKKE